MRKFARKRRPGPGGGEGRGGGTDVHTLQVTRDILWGKSDVRDK